jgi:hypothetical protein
VLFYGKGEYMELIDLKNAIVEEITDLERALYIEDAVTRGDLARILSRILQTACLTSLSRIEQEYQETCKLDNTYHNDTYSYGGYREPIL